MPTSALRCLVVDDDLLSVQVVLNCIANTPFLTAIGSHTNSIEAAEDLRTQQVDLLFLDVEMPLMSGIELLRTLLNPPPVVAFVVGVARALEDAADGAEAELASTLPEGADGAIPKLFFKSVL